MSELEGRVVPGYTSYIEASHRFNYFVTGGAGAALAFSLEKFDPGALPGAEFLVPVAWGLLLTSLGAGLYHISAGVSVLKLGAQILEHGSERRRLRAKLSEGQAQQLGVVFVDSGREFTRAEAEDYARRLDKRLADGAALSERVNRRAAVAYTIRNLTIVAGFVALAVWKTLNV